MIDLMCQFGGKVRSIQSLVKKYAVKVNIDDTTSALFEFNNKCTGNLTTIFACPYTSKFNIFGTYMNIFSEVDNNKIKRISFQDKPESIIYPYEELPLEWKKLNGFVWRDSERVRSKADIWK